MMESLRHLSKEKSNLPAPRDQLPQWNRKQHNSDIDETFSTSLKNCVVLVNTFGLLNILLKIHKVWIHSESVSLLALPMVIYSCLVFDIFALTALNGIFCFGLWIFSHMCCSKVTLRVYNLAVIVFVALLIFTSIVEHGFFLHTNVLLTSDDIMVIFEAAPALLRQAQGESVNPMLIFGGIGWLVLLWTALKFLIKTIRKMGIRLKEFMIKLGVFLMLTSVASPIGLMYSYSDAFPDNLSLLTMNWSLGICHGFIYQYFHKLESSGYAMVQDDISQSVDSVEKSKLTHIILVMMESTRADMFEPGLPQTPFITQLAKEGLFTSNMYTSLPNTNKSFFQVICGIHPYPLPMWVEYDVMETLKKFCLPSLLEQIGYRSLLVTGSSLGVINTAGYDESIGYYHSAIESLGENSESAAKKAWKAIQPGEEVKLEHGNFAKVNYLGLDDRVTIKKTIDFLLDSEHQEKKAFVTTVTVGPHHWYGLPKDCEEEARKVLSGFPGPEKSSKINYQAALLCQDIFLRELTDELKRNDLYDKTSLFLVGDHGESFFEHGFDRHGGHVFDEGIRVPFLAKGPHIQQDKVMDKFQNWQLIDVKPTILDAIGLSNSDLYNFNPFCKTDIVKDCLDLERSKNLVGASLLATDELDFSRRIFVTNHFGNRQVAVIVDGMKVIAQMDSGRNFFNTQLYNLKTDPFEKKGASSKSLSVTSDADLEDEVYMNGVHMNSESSQIEKSSIGLQLSASTANDLLEAYRSWSENLLSFYQSAQDVVKKTENDRSKNQNIAAPVVKENENDSSKNQKRKKRRKRIKRRKEKVPTTTEDIINEI